MKVVFFGSSKFVIPILEVLRKNFDLRLVLTTENPKGSKPNLASQGVPLRSWTVISYCLENKIPYVSVSNLSNPIIKSKLLNINASIAVLADFGLIIPRDILNAFPKGIINIHPSLLPKYRGPTPVQTAILNGDKTTGVSIIKLDDEIDHGPILGQGKEEILSIDTSETLYKRLFAKGAVLLLKVLNKYINGELNPIPQNPNEATFTKPLNRQDGYLNVSNATTTVTKIDTMIKAYYPWPGVWFKIKANEKEKIVKLLPNNKIQAEGKKPMSYKDFKNGYPNLKQIHVLLDHLSNQEY